MVVAPSWNYPNSEGHPVNRFLEEQAQALDLGNSGPYPKDGHLSA